MRDREFTLLPHLGGRPTSRMTPGESYAVELSKYDLYIEFPFVRRTRPDGGRNRERGEQFCRRISDNPEGRLHCAAKTATRIHTEWQLERPLYSGWRSRLE